MNEKTEKPTGRVDSVNPPQFHGRPGTHPAGSFFVLTKPNPRPGPYLYSPPLRYEIWHEPTNTKIGTVYDPDTAERIRYALEAPSIQKPSWKTPKPTKKFASLRSQT